MMNRTTDRILVNSVPKSGTYLLSKTVNLLGYRNFTLRENLLQKVIWGLGLGHPKALGYETISVNWGRRLYEWIGIGRHSVTVPIGADSPLQIPAKLAARWLQTTPPRSFIVGHVPWSPTMDRLLQQHGYKHIVITRDPRDVVISLVHYVSRPSHNLYADFMRLAEDERVPFVITGGYAPISGRHVAGVEALFRSVMDWKQSKNCLMVQFENLIGEKGGE